MTILERAKVYQINDVARMAMNNLYGLGYSINFLKLVDRQMMIRALDLDDDYSFYTTAQRQNVESQLSIYNKCK